MRSLVLWVVVLPAVALAALASVLCVVLYRYTVRRYQVEQRLRMDPTGSALFVPRNAELSATKGGEARVVLFGDSRVEMWFPSLKIDGAQVVNQGWSGETTGQAILRLDRDVIALRPRIVVIEYGMNDLKGIGFLPEQEEAIIENCTQNLKSMVKRLRDQEITVVVLTVYPVGPVTLARRPIWSDRIPAAIARVNRGLSELAGPGLIVIDCDPTLASDGRMRPPYARDVFHLTSGGYQALNELLEPRLRSLLSDVSIRQPSR